MAKTKVLLLKPVLGVGNEGDVVSVAAGYARNYLLPKSFAIAATNSNKKQIEALEKRKEERIKLELENAEAVKTKLESLRVAIPVRTGKQGDRIQIFGAINAHRLIERLAEEKVELEAKQFHFADQIKTLGKHTIQIRITNEIVVDFEFEVVSENPIEDTVEA